MTVQVEAAIYLIDLQREKEVKRKRMIQEISQRFIMSHQEDLLKAKDQKGTIRLIGQIQGDS